MHFNHYSDEGALLAAELVNRSLDSPADIEALAIEHDLLLDVTPTASDVAGLREWTAALVEVVDARLTSTRIVALNQLLSRGTSHPLITEHDGRPPHLHFRPHGVTPARQIAAITAFGLAWFLTQRGMHRFARCAAADCTRTYADVTRNGRQRYCSTRCASRQAVRRHRSRGSAQNGPTP